MEEFRDPVALRDPLDLDLEVGVVVEMELRDLLGLKGLQDHQVGPLDLKVLRGVRVG
jgi:hypothetical protein